MKETVTNGPGTEAFREILRNSPRIAHPAAEGSAR